MTEREQQAVLGLVKQARKQADAIIVVGITPDGFFFDCDDRVALPDLRQLLESSAAPVCESVSRGRARKAKEKK